MRKIAPQPTADRAPHAQSPLPEGGVGAAALPVPDTAPPQAESAGEHFRVWYRQRVWDLTDMTDTHYQLTRVRGEDESSPGRRQTIRLKQENIIANGEGAAERTGLSPALLARAGAEGGPENLQIFEHVTDTRQRVLDVIDESDIAQLREQFDGKEVAYTSAKGETYEGPATVAPHPQTGQMMVQVKLGDRLPVWLTAATALDPTRLRVSDWQQVRELFDGQAVKYLAQSGVEYDGLAQMATHPKSGRAMLRVQLGGKLWVWVKTADALSGERVWLAEPAPSQAETPDEEDPDSNPEKPLWVPPESDPATEPKPIEPYTPPAVQPTAPPTQPGPDWGTDAGPTETLDAGLMAELTAQPTPDAQLVRLMQRFMQLSFTTEDEATTMRQIKTMQAHLQTVGQLPDVGPATQQLQLHLTALLTMVTDTADLHQQLTRLEATPPEGVDFAAEVTRWRGLAEQAKAHKVHYNQHWEALRDWHFPVEPMADTPPPAAPDTAPTPQTGWRGGLSRVRGWGRRLAQRLTRRRQPTPPTMNLAGLHQHWVRKLSAYAVGAQQQLTALSRRPENLAHLTDGSTVHEGWGALKAMGAWLLHGDAETEKQVTARRVKRVGGPSDDPAPDGASGVSWGGVQPYREVMDLQPVGKVPLAA